ncbi:FAD-dependent thymidylate synthase [Candidatus Bipolaricaulota bacterium]|nr:FAD-dependent thymidylate synthase [Candidatus Bipolaricaulota bacterium]
MKIELLRHTEKPESMIAQAARISHQTTGNEKDYSPEEDRELIRKLRSWGHWSPFEFASATFYVEGISRSCLAQLTRHRLASFMVRSMRYVKQNQEEVVIPQSVKEAGLDEEYREGITKSHDLYQKALDAGVPKEDARFLLPIGSKTSLYLKTNFREFRHIIELRGGEEAQWEIRELAEGFLARLSEMAPAVFEDLRKDS